MIAAVNVNPKNPEALIQLGNFYYDHKLFQKATDYYRRALELEPRNVDVLTDLGTAYWYQGSAEKAIAEYEKALAAQPNYPQTLMNLGIVRMEGLKDNRGALAVWKMLLETNPSFPEKQRVLQLISRAETANK